MTSSEAAQLLSGARPRNPQGADFLLDIREILLEKGHPGDCVQCFFGLLGNLDRPGALAPLRHWLEQNLEVAVEIDGETRETMPVSFGNSRTLNDYCLRMVDLVRNDRSYQEDSIRLRFQYRGEAQAA